MASKVSFDTPIQAGDQSFDRVLNAGLPVAALFWNGSKLDSMLEEELNSRAHADAGNLLVVKVKSGDSPDLVRRYNLRSPSTFITFRAGRERTRVENPSRAAVGEHVEYLLGRSAKPPVEEGRPATETRPSPAGKPVTTTDAAFELQVMQSPVPVVVDFWAPWCGPCHMVAPSLEKIAAEFQGRLRVAKMNVDENPITAERHQVKSIPTLLFVKNGRIVDRVVGALPEPQIRLKVEQLLAG
jgi:thioredoxin 1